MPPFVHKFLHCLFVVIARVLAILRGLRDSVIWQGLRVLVVVSVDGVLGVRFVLHGAVRAPDFRWRRVGQREPPRAGGDL